MKKLILLLAFAGACAAQTSPTIVKTVNLVNETELAGAPKSPVVIFTTTQDGFYRMTLSIGTEANQEIQLCPTLMGNRSNQCISAVAEESRPGSGNVVFAFTAKAGSTIGFYTTPGNAPYTGTYNADLVVELLPETPAAS